MKSFKNRRKTLFLSLLALLFCINPLRPSFAAAIQTPGVLDDFAAAFFDSDDTSTGPSTPSCEGPLKTKTVWVKGAGDVTDKYYIQAMTNLRQKYKTHFGLTVVFVDNSKFWRENSNKAQKMQKIITKIRDNGSQYLDVFNDSENAFFKNNCPDYYLVATPDFDHVDSAHEMLQRCPQTKIFIEKPLDADPTKAHRFVAKYNGNENVYSLDHWGARFVPTNAQKQLIHTHLGGAISKFTLYFVEDGSGSDPKVKDHPNRARNGAIEIVERVPTLNSGASLDAIPHAFPLMYPYGRIRSIQVNKIQAGRYTGVGDNPVAPTEIKAETFSKISFTMEAREKIDANASESLKDLPLIEGTVYIGKGVRGSKKLGPNYDGNTKLAIYVGVNGNILVLDLRSSSPNGRHSKAYLYDKNKNATGTMDMNANPYEVYFDYMVNDQGNKVALPVADALKSLEIINSGIVRAIQAPDITLPLYQGGGIFKNADGSERVQQAPYIEDLEALLPEILGPHAPISFTKK